ncbi:MAG: nicotinate-nucleotide--dimethylbenzimidazole phosphoribosyltransferase [Hyphomicrobiaceae bacterium]
MPDEIHWIADPVPAPSESARAEARRRQDMLAKPAGSLGVLERIVVTLAGMQATPLPSAEVVPIVVFAADHGVAAEKVSPYPSSVTVSMLRNFVDGGAAIAVLARALGLRLSVIDAGTLAEEPVAGVITDKPCCGTRDLALGPAMTEAEVAHALAAGRRAVMRISNGADLVILGEMGIANTTAAAAVAAAILGLPARALAGAGTGLDAAGIAHKAEVIATALRVNRLASGEASPIDALTRVGGLEIAALTGAIIAAAQLRLPVLVDGFIVSVAALAACRMVPGVRDWLIFSHCSAEQGHAVVLAALEAEPVATLGLRLGEGSGAAVVLPLVRLACALNANMATLDAVDIGVPEKV